MPNIQLPEKLILRRIHTIRKILIPIARKSDGPNVKFIPRGRNVILSASDDPTDSDYEKRHFSTCVKNYSATYYETWSESTTRENSFYLYRSYLHIYRINKEGNKEEVLLLHSDPNEGKDEKHYKYKRGPHLHLMLLEQPFPHSHIALSLTTLNEVSRSIDSLTKCLKLSIEMIRDQFLDAVE